MQIKNTLDKTNIPVYYSHAPKLTRPPYLVFMGNGQTAFDAENTIYYRKNTYRIEYYYKLKDEATEAAIEDLLLADGFIYSKSEDIYIDDEGVFAIYYFV